MSEPSTQTYTNGPFTVTETTLSDSDGRQWLELTISASSICRVPLDDPFQKRNTQIKAERMNLHTMAEAIGQALESDDETNG